MGDLLGSIVGISNYCFNNTFRTSLYTDMKVLNGGFQIASVKFYLLWYFKKF